MNRIPSLDGIRALSILLVLFGHLAGTTHFLEERFLSDDAADLGVHIFFVMSGFLITQLLLQERENRSRIHLADFYLRRAFRIFPAAYLYLVCTWIALWPQIKSTEIAVAALYLSNFAHPRWVLAHLWSLSVEEQFYLLWPAVLVFAYRSSLKVVVGVIVSAPALRALFYLHGWKDVNHYFPTVADAMATGCLLALVIPKLGRWKGKLSSPFVLYGSACSTFALLGVDYWNRGLFNLVGLTIMHICIALFLYAAIQRKSGFLNWKSLVFLGQASYSIYLWQMPFCDRHSHHWWTAFPVNLLLALTLGCASLYLVERPALALGKVFRSRLSGRQNAREKAVFPGPQHGIPGSAEQLLS